MIKLFFLFLGHSQPVLDRNNVRINFFNFLNFFTIFYLEFSCSGWVGIEFGSKIFCSLSQPMSSPVLAKNNARNRFFNFFWFFFYFFRNFLARVEYERNSGLKFFSRFLYLSHPILAKNNAGKSFCNFLNFLAIFFGIFVHWSGMKGIQV